MSTWNIFITLCLWTVVSGEKKERKFRRELVSEDLEVLASYQGYRSSLECAAKFGQERHKDDHCLAYTFDPDSRTCFIYKVADSNPSPMNNLVLYKFIRGPFCNTSDGFEQVLVDDQIFCYAFMRSSKTYSDARQHCLDLGAYLLNFDDVLERRAVRSFHEGSYWVNANDIIQEGKWVSGKDGKSISGLWPPWWQYNVPEPSNKPGEDCGNVWRKGSSFWLYDSLCHYDRHYICERTT